MTSYILTPLLVAILTVFASITANAAGSGAPKWASCDCEESTCGPCEIETGVSFYSAKCGVDNTRVKSCKKPSCVAVENQKACLALFNKTTDPQVSIAREPASTEVTPAESVKAGEVVQTAGVAKIIRASGPLENPKEGLTVYVGDTVETQADGKVKIVLRDSSEMMVPANSKVRIDVVKYDEASGSRKVALNLLMGKVRSKVQKRYEGENSFKVRMKTAVAGVRGTDFIASFEKGEREWVSEVRTLEGLVRLESAQPTPKSGITVDELRPPKTVEIPAGTYAAFVIGPPPQKTDSEEEFFRSIEQGSITPVMSMQQEEMQDLREKTDFVKSKASKKEPARTTTSLDSEDLCHAPSGKFNQCAFTCEGNAKGDKKCRTDLPGVSCVRRLCRASGMWAEPKRMPASHSDSCEVGRIVVRDCNSYW